MTQEYVTGSAEETRQLGLALAKSLQSGTVVALEGDLGAGKTTLTQGILEGLGVEGPYTSPTFVIMKQYDVPLVQKNGIRRIYHVDAYRIETEDIEKLGFDEWINDPEGLVLVEWPERIRKALPQDMLTFSLQWLDDAKRRIMLRQS